MFGSKQLGLLEKQLICLFFPPVLLKKPWSSNFLCKREPEIRIWALALGEITSIKRQMISQRQSLKGHEEEEKEDEEEEKEEMAIRDTECFAFLEGGRRIISWLAYKLKSYY